MTCRQASTGLPRYTVVHMRDWTTPERDTDRAYWLSEAIAIVVSAWLVVGVLAWIGGLL